MGVVNCSRVSASSGKLVIMNLEYSSIGFNPNQWKFLLDQKNVCYFLVDNEEDQEIISWLRCQREWQAIAHSRNITLFHRNTTNLIIPEV